MNLGAVGRMTQQQAASRLSQLLFVRWVVCPHRGVVLVCLSAVTMASREGTETGGREIYPFTRETDPGVLASSTISSVVAS